MRSISITVCICTHSPDPAHLARVIEALKAQTLSARNWEVLLIENNAVQTCDASILSSLPCSSRLILESLPGKVNAMVSASAVASGDWIVFADDDNLLDPDYLEQLLKLAATYPMVGVMSGSITGEYTEPVPQWAGEFLHYLAIRPLTRPFWANISGRNIGPIGAGMCVKREIYDEFVAAVRSGEIDSSMGRTSGSLTAGADDTVFMDIAFRLGFGCGAFPEIRLTHLIKAERTSVAYLKRIAYDINRSHAILEGKQSVLKLWKLRLNAMSILFLHAREVRDVKLSEVRGRLAGMRQVTR